MLFDAVSIGFVRGMRLTSSPVERTPHFLAQIQLGVYNRTISKKNYCSVALSRKSLVQINMPKAVVVHMMRLGQN